MRLIKKASLDAYARQFWQRQEQKGNCDDEHAISGIKGGEIGGTAVPSATRLVSDSSLLAVNVRPSAFILKLYL